MISVGHRPEIRFIVVFLVILGTSFTVVALRPVNDGLVLPYTSWIARLSGSVLSALGEDITVSGCDLRSPRFAVTIYNGCNGLITSLVFASAVLAFPSTWRAKGVGLGLGLLAIQIVNLVRIISLYFIGAAAPRLFNTAHIVVWQSLVILAGVVLWILWARWAVATRNDP